MLYSIYKTKSSNLVISFIKATLLKQLAKTPYKSVLYKKWPRNPPY
jgi:hypothetical protein